MKTIVHVTFICMMCKYDVNIYVPTLGNSIVQYCEIITVRVREPLNKDLLLQCQNETPTDL